MEDEDSKELKDVKTKNNKAFELSFSNKNKFVSNNIIKYNSNDESQNNGFNMIKD